MYPILYKIRTHIYHPLVVFFIFLLSAIFIYHLLYTLYLYQDDFVWLSHAQDVWQHGASIFTLKISHFIMPMIYEYFALLYRVIGTTPIYYYNVNILIHSINATILYVILHKFTAPRHALFGAGIFLTLRYPVEALAWISAVTVLLTTFFLLLAGFFWLIFLETKKTRYYILSILITICLILTKEWSVLILPFLVFLTILYHHATLQTFSLKKYIILALPYILLFLVYFTFQTHLQQTNVLIEKGYYVFGFHAIPHIVDNILLTILPLTTVALTYPYYWTLAGTLALVTVLTAGSILYYKKHIPLIFGLLWMILAFIPTSFFTWDHRVSRYAYIPALGVAFMISYLSNTMHLIPRYARVIFYSGVICYMAINIGYIQKVISYYYAPVHEENYAFSRALHDISPHIEYPLAIIDNTPHKGFILPEILQVEIHIPSEQVIVVPDDVSCQAYTYCLKWHEDTKIIELL